MYLFSPRLSVRRYHDSELHTHKKKKKIFFATSDLTVNRRGEKGGGAHRGALHETSVSSYFSSFLGAFRSQPREYLSNQSINQSLFREVGLYCRQVSRLHTTRRLLHKSHQVTPAVGLSLLKVFQKDWSIGNQSFRSPIFRNSHRNPSHLIELFERV